jgi:hydroxymethylglutaryl-CoA synthase
MTEIGIIGMEVYFPNTYVDQEELEAYYGVGKGKYTVGLGQQKMAFTSDREDINSISMTVVSNLVNNYGIDWKDVGRLEVGTETIIDKSKSTKTCLMELFKSSGNHDIEGVTSINACYGGTNALFNTLNWMESNAWDGRYGIVVAADLAVYAKGPARATGGAGAVAMLIGPNAPLVIETNVRSTFMDNQYDFYKPDPNSEYPTVDGVLSQNTYINALLKTYSGVKEKSESAGFSTVNMVETDYFCFHAPYSKLVQKSFLELFWQDIKDGHIEPSPALQKVIDETGGNLKEKALVKALTKESAPIWKAKTDPALTLSRNCGNSYTASVYFGLMSLICDPEVDLANKRLCIFSYGSGCAASMFTIRGKEDYTIIRDTSDFHKRLANRIKKSPEVYEACLAEREERYGHSNYESTGPLEELLPGTFYLSKIDDKWRREYSKVPCVKKSIKVMKSPMITFNSQRSKLFELSKL